MNRVKVEELAEGDLVDLAGDPYADEGDITLEYEYVQVAGVERETPRCTVVHFEGYPSCGFPVGHKVPVARPADVVEIIDMGRTDGR